MATRWSKDFRPDAKTLAVIDRANPTTKFVAQRIAEEGVFEAIANGQPDRFDYLLEVTNWAGETTQIADPYSFGPLLGELDMHLYCKGTHYEIYRKLGAHLMEVNGHAGVLSQFGLRTPNGHR